MTYTGTIDGAEFRVEVPRDWNGTLLVFSHPYYVEGIPPGIGLSGRPETETWLLDWFVEHLGAPAHPIATGSSMGATLSIMLAEHRPDRSTVPWPSAGRWISHCAATAVEKVVALQTLLTRIDTGSGRATPAFAELTPSVLPRPSR